MAVVGVISFASAGVLADRAGADAVRVAALGFSTTRIGSRSVGSAAMRVVEACGSGPSAETDIRTGDSLLAVAGAGVAAVVAGAAVAEAGG